MIERASLHRAAVPVLYLRGLRAIFKSGGAGSSVLSSTRAAARAAPLLRIVEDRGKECMVRTRALLASAREASHSGLAPRENMRLAAAALLVCCLGSRRWFHHRACML